MASEVFINFESEYIRGTDSDVPIFTGMRFENWFYSALWDAYDPTVRNLAKGFAPLNENVVQVIQTNGSILNFKVPFSGDCKLNVKELPPRFDFFRKHESQYK